MRLTLSALAELEAGLGAQSLVEVVGRFETGAFRVADLIAILRAGLGGGGWRISEEALSVAEIEGGPLAAARAAARLLKLTFALPGDEG